MKKKEYLTKLDALGLDKNDYCIIASGSMLMHDLCDEVSDIDIKVTNKVYWLEEGYDKVIKGIGAFEEE